MIVIGGSLGGSDALGVILSALPADFPLPIAVVIHRHKESVGLLAPQVQKSSALPVHEVVDKEPILPGHVYLCPADYHLLIDDGYFSLSVDDLVFFARPSVDVLFESAAETLGPRAIAVVLSGAGSDGSRVVAKLLQHGSRLLIQDPETAAAKWMPAASLAAAPSALILPLEKIAPELVRLAGSPPFAPAKPSL